MAEDKTRGVVIRSQEGEDFEAPSGTNHLLAIAIDKYEHCPVLSNCVNDVRGLIEVLKERYDFQDANIQTLINEEATRPNIHAYLKGLKDRVRPQDNVIIYFSGHGETEDNVGYWIPVEAHPAHEWEFVSTNDIKSRLDSINSFHTFVIVDACFSGALFSSYRSVKAGNENKRSRLGLAASHTKERALDGEGENSPFSSHLLKMLWENTGALSAHKLAGEIIDEVYAATKGKQTPVFKPLDVKGDDSGQYVFRLKADEGSDWEACQRVGTLATYEAFFAKYPEGKYIAEAQEKIAQLRDKEAWQTAKGLHTISAYLQYRKDKPDGQHREEALEAVQQVEEDQSWHQAQKKKTIFEYEQYLENTPPGDMARKRELLWKPCWEGMRPQTSACKTDAVPCPGSNEASDSTGKTRPEAKGGKGHCDHAQQQSKVSDDRGRGLACRRAGGLGHIFRKGQIG
ncbi:MAG: caspase family protein [Saprospirales bacterium]|nr:caspase family protein [Saprospirales bacterium]